MSNDFMTNFLLCFAITSFIGSFVLGRIIAHFLIKHNQKRDELMLLCALKYGVISTKQYKSLNYLAGLNTATLSKLEEKADEFYESVERNYATCEEIKAQLDKFKAEYMKKLKENNTQA